MKTSIARLLTATTLALAAHAAMAADSSPAPAAANDKLAAARAQIASLQWTAAIDELKRVNDVRNPDWHNLMGYSLRKAKTPDLVAAERAYNEALRLDPTHRGALEYSGELYLMKGELTTAEQRLATLGKACAKTCEEYRELQFAIDRYKANGNKHVARQGGW